jgi:hypothetical protein
MKKKRASAEADARLRILPMVRGAVLLFTLSTCPFRHHVALLELESFPDAQQL